MSIKINLQPANVQVYPNLFMFLQKKKKTKVGRRLKLLLKKKINKKQKVGTYIFCCCYIVFFLSLFARYTRVSIARVRDKVFIFFNMFCMKKYFMENFCNFSFCFFSLFSIRSSKLFLCTVVFDDIIYDDWIFIREDIVLHISYLCENWLVCVEHEDDGGMGRRHLHFYFKLKDASPINTVRMWLVELFEFGNLDLQVVRSERNILKYLSKEDLKLVTNVRISELNFIYRVHKWASSVKYFDYTHPFVVEHRNQHNYLQKYFSDYKYRDSHLFDLNLCAYTFPCSWANAVVRWFNTSLLKCKAGLVRFEQLYLYGEHNIGKTYIVELLLSQLADHLIYYPDVGKFLMNHFKEGRHKVIVFEEYKNEFHCESYLKRLLENRQYAFPIKGLPALQFAYKGLVIFISNYPFAGDEALESRLKIIHAQGSSY